MSVEVRSNLGIPVSGVLVTLTLANVTSDENGVSSFGHLMHHGSHAVISASKNGYNDLRRELTIQDGHRVEFTMTHVDLQVGLTLDIVIGNPIWYSVCSVLVHAGTAAHQVHFRACGDGLDYPDKIFPKFPPSPNAGGFRDQGCSD